MIRFLVVLSIGVAALQVSQLTANDNANIPDPVVATCSVVVRLCIPRVRSRMPFEDKPGQKSTSGSIREKNPTKLKTLRLIIFNQNFSVTKVT